LPRQLGYRRASTTRKQAKANQREEWAKLDIQQIIEGINEHVVQKELTKLKLLIHSLPLSEQLTLHQYIPVSSLVYLLEHRAQLSLHSGVIEHMMWRYYQQLHWSTAMLQDLLADYQRERFIALQSIVIEAIKNDKLTEDQEKLIVENMSHPEIHRQLLFWQMRLKLRAAISFHRSEIENLIHHRGYSLIIEALDAKLIASADLSLFKEPIPKERDYKWKKQLWSKALNN